MCLFLTKTPKTVRAKTRTKVFKLMFQSGDRFFNLFDTTTYYEFVLNKINPSSRTNSQIEPSERHNIEQGFHCCLNLEVARAFVNHFMINFGKTEVRNFKEFESAMGRNRVASGDFTGSVVIVECEVDPKDHVADGYEMNLKKFLHRNVFAVYTKIIPIRVVQ